VVRKLVVVSTPFRRNGFYPEILAQQVQVGAAAAEAMKQTPMYQLQRSRARGHGHSVSRRGSADGSVRASGLGPDRG